MRTASVSDVLTRLTGGRRGSMRTRGVGRLPVNDVMFKAAPQGGEEKGPE